MDENFRKIVKELKKVKRGLNSQIKEYEECAKQTVDMVSFSAQIDNIRMNGNEFIKTNREENERLMRQEQNKQDDE